MRLLPKRGSQDHQTAHSGGASGFGEVEKGMWLGGNRREAHPTPGNQASKVFQGIPGQDFPEHVLKTGQNSDLFFLFQEILLLSNPKADMAPLHPQETTPIIPVN